MIELVPAARATMMDGNGAGEPDRACRTILAEVVSEWNDAARSWTPEALGALYCDDALLFGGRPDHSIGRKAIEAYFASYGGIILSASLDLADQILLPIRDDEFAAQGYARFAFRLVGDRSTHSNLRTTLILRREESWRIRLHHFSGLPEAPPLGN